MAYVTLKAERQYAKSANCCDLSERDAMSVLRSTMELLAIDTYAIHCKYIAHVAIPKQLPHSISPLNHPYSRHKLLRDCSSIRRQRYNMTPLARALMQYAAICSQENVTCSLLSAAQKKLGRFGLVLCLQRQR